MELEPTNVSAGLPSPLGATLTDTGCNFAIHCPHAERVELCFFDSDTEELASTIGLSQRTHSVWHIHVDGITTGQLYGYRTSGANVPDMGICFDSDKLLIDPYTRCLSRPLVWNQRLYEGDSQLMIPKSTVTCSHADGTSGRPPKPGIAHDKLILYEAHVKGLTQQHPQVDENFRGKYLGVSSPAMIRHFTELGITVVQLMPVMAFMPEPFITEKGLTNYWGYNPVNFFSPEPRYGISDPVLEFRQMVDQLHAANIEVILDVVFNHTAEGGIDGPILSFKGFDNKCFYLFEQHAYGAEDYTRYSNNSGCGNSLNMTTAFVFKLLLDALRYWSQEMGVDGFRFDLAASLGRCPYEFSRQAAFFQALNQDPHLSTCKLIAEPWDIGHGGYRLGHFPSKWHECNDRYRDTVRSFWRGDEGVTGEFASRLLGSRDIFPKGSRSIHTSVNNVTYHDGFTLHDLVSYARKHNDANLEHNRDGHSHNLSANYGTEGPTSDSDILILREKQKRNMFTTLVLSQGVPHILGGDELSRSQQGNNNAYCQDNELNWFDWTLNECQEDFLHFCKYVIELRAKSPLIRGMLLNDDAFKRGSNVAGIRWYRPDGAKKIEQDWNASANKAFAVEVEGANACADEHWLFIFNAFDHDVRFHLPELTHGCWFLKLDTRYAKLAQQPAIKTSNVFLQAYRTISVFQRVTG